jgi:signal transduction histidine kinase
MNLLMADLMDISMMEAGKFNMSFKEFSYNGLIEDVYNLQSLNAQKKGITFMRYPYPDNITVCADRFRISQVLNNLVGNAIKFTPQGGRIEIRFQLEDDKVNTFVSDTGAGVAHYEQSKIFQKFHQGENLEKRAKKQGWGLGLSIAQEIIHAHKGGISVESAGPRQGSVFEFWLPLVHTSN